MQEEVRPQPDAKKKLFFGLFVFPLIIAVTMAVLLCSVVLMTHEAETPESLITAIKTGAPSKRWQKAFELSNELNREGGILRSAGIMKEVIHILNDSEHYDPRTRAYMAMALSRYQNSEAEEALQNALSQVDIASEDVTLPMFLMWALGNYQNPKSAEFVERFTVSEDPALRKTSAYVLGVLGNRAYEKKLEKLLEDTAVDVQWNAALALARFGNPAAKNTLLQMLDRSYLKKASEMNDVQTEQVMINAAKALALLGHQESVSLLESLSKTDESLKVRQASLVALQHISQLTR